MGRSYRTDKPRVIAARRLPRDTDGEIVLPPILVHRPRRGDVHPISGAVMRGVLRTEVPIEYLHGLQRIEMRPRMGEVGEPFAWYLPDERAILLYSLPEEWTWEPDVPEEYLAKLRRMFAEITVSKTSVHVRWPDRAVLALWFFVEVLAHELGHHYRYQYRIRRGSARARQHEEFVARLHSERFFDALRRRIIARRKRTS
jgi:hypothetical protein